MQAKHKAVLWIGSASLMVVLGFQNCSDSGFKSGNYAPSSTGAAESTGQSVSSTGGQTQAAQVMPGGDAENLGPVPDGTQYPLLAVGNPEASGVCYDVTCRTIVGGYSTIRGITDANGIIMGLGPGGGSTYLVRINDQHQIASELGCTPDQWGGAPDFGSSPLCSTNAPSTVSSYQSPAYTGTPTFAKGEGVYGRQCEITACDYMETDGYRQTNNIYTWVAARWDESSSAAQAKVRTYDMSGHLKNLVVGLDASLTPGGACASKTVVDHDNPDNKDFTLSFQMCLSAAKLLTISSPGRTFYLDLSSQHVSHPSQASSGAIVFN